jgi:GTP-binding protein Era
MQDVDAIVFVIEKDIFTKEDESVARQLSSAECPVIVALNKSDQLDDQATLLPFVEKISPLLPKAEFLPISAKNGEKVDVLLELLCRHLPQSPMPIYPEDQVTDRSMRFLASEIIREKVVRLTGAELPYQTAVEIEEFREEGNLLRISAVVLTEREGQKRIVIGERGARIKQVGIDARRDMEALFDSKVMLNIWVKVKTGWSDDNRALRSLGFDDD